MRISSDVSTGRAARRWARLVLALAGQPFLRSSASALMSVRLGCIADDYTGASDLANTLTKCGLRTVQTIGIPADSFSLPDVSVVVVSLKIRSIAAAEAVAQARAADAWLRKRG